MFCVQANVCFALLNPHTLAGKKELQLSFSSALTTARWSTQHVERSASCYIRPPRNAGYVRVRIPIYSHSYLGNSGINLIQRPAPSLQNQTPADSPPSRAPVAPPSRAAVVRWGWRRSSPCAAVPRRRPPSPGPHRATLPVCNPHTLTSASCIK